MNKINASQANIAYKYKNVKLKLLKTDLNIKFNKTCLDNNITPKYINIIIANKSYAAKKAKTLAETAWIKNEIKFLYMKKDMLNKLLLRNHIELLNSVHPTQTFNLIQIINGQINNIINKKRKNQLKKIKELIKTQSKPLDQIIINHTFYPRIKNTTDIIFDDDETSLLNMGIKHNFIKGNPKNNIISEILNAEIAINGINDEGQRNYLRHLIDIKVKKIITKNKNNTYLNNSKKEFQVVKSIKEKLIQHNCILTKADKGQTLVILKRDEYNEKVLNFIETNNIKEIQKDPTDKFNLSIKNALNKTEHAIPQESKKYLKMINPRAPTLRGLPKIHKEDIPIRPLVNFTSAPGYKLSKLLERLIRNNIKLNNSHSIKNSYELIDFTKDIHIEHRYTLASLDISNMYTNIPVKDTLDITKKNLLSHSDLDIVAVNEIMKLLELVLQQNYFTFDGKFYIQAEGLAMGSPLSCILADIYLNEIENRHIITPSNRHNNKIILYKRYVDDIFIIFNGNARQLNLLLKYTNNINKNLKFTLETENENQLNYLDLTLIKMDNKIEYKIYRKPTITDHTIHHTSNHPMPQKMAAYRSFINRLLRVPMSLEHYIEEHNILKYIAVKNGYDEGLIDRLIFKMKRNINNNNHTMANPNQNKFISIEYGPQLHYILKNQMKKHNITLACKTTHRLVNSVSRSSEKPSNKRDDTGIYKINCGDCPKFYIGQTGRSFDTRFKEHLPTRHHSQKSKLAEHLVHNNHNVNSRNDNLEILHKCKKGHLMNTLERYEIHKAICKTPDDVLNEKLNTGINILFSRIDSIKEC